MPRNVLTAVGFSPRLSSHLRGDIRLWRVQVEGEKAVLRRYPAHRTVPSRLSVRTAGQGELEEVIASVLPWLGSDHRTFEVRLVEQLFASDVLTTCPYSAKMDSSLSNSAAAGSGRMKKEKAESPRVQTNLKLTAKTARSLDVASAVEHRDKAEIVEEALKLREQLMGERVQGLSKGCPNPPSFDRRGRAAPSDRNASRGSTRSYAGRIGNGFGGARETEGSR